MKVIHVILVFITKSPVNFASIAWNSFAGEMGIIAGGMFDGTVTLWDVNSIVKSKNEKLGHGCVSSQNVHDGYSVNAIEFNSLKPHLLASGGKEVYIQDLSKSI